MENSFGNQGLPVQNTTDRRNFNTNLNSNIKSVAMTILGPSSNIPTLETKNHPKSNDNSFMNMQQATSNSTNIDDYSMSLDFGGGPYAM